MRTTETVKGFNGEKGFGFIAVRLDAAQSMPMSNEQRGYFERGRSK